MLARMGAQVSLRLERYGFYPAGGGRFIAEIEPCPDLKPLELGERGEVRAKRATAIVANLPYKIAAREIEKVTNMINLSVEGTILSTKDSPGPGNIVFIEVESEQVTEVFSGFGRVGILAEAVAEEVVHDAREYLVSRAAAGEYLTDQLLLPLALAGGGSFTATKLSRHATTNRDVIAMFLPVRFQVDNLENCCVVRVA